MCFPELPYRNNSSAYPQKHCQEKQTFDDHNSNLYQELQSNQTYTLCIPDNQVKQLVPNYIQNATGENDKYLDT